MDVVNVGSISIDHHYELARLPGAGSVQSTLGYRCDLGGKGAIQSVALRRAGASVRHVGRVGVDGTWMLAELAVAGVDTTAVAVGHDASGHRVIQRDPGGRTARLAHGGENHLLDGADIGRALATAGPDAVVLVQHELDLAGEVVVAAHRAGLRVVLDASPFDERALTLPLELVDLLVVGEQVASALAGRPEPLDALRRFRRRWPGTAVLMIGGEWAWYADADGELATPIPPGPRQDDTGADDAFLGWFLATRIAGGDLGDALGAGAVAASRTAAIGGSAASLPSAEAVRAELVRQRPDRPGPCTGRGDAGGAEPIPAADAGAVRAPVDAHDPTAALRVHGRRRGSLIPGGPDRAIAPPAVDLDPGSDGAATAGARAGTPPGPGALPISGPPLAPQPSVR